MKEILNRPILVAAILFVSIFIIFFNNHALSLWDEDESAYAGFAQNMRKTGNWAIPDFIWSDIHRKPPLHFWAIAGAYSLFGENEFATRIPSALGILLTAAALFSMGRKLFGRDTAACASIILLCSLFLPSIAKISITDPLLLFFETVSVLSLFRYLYGGRKIFILPMLIGISLALLTKGPPILILIYGIFGILFLFGEHRAKLVFLFFLSMVAFLPMLIWGKAAWLKDGGEYVRWMIDWYGPRRVTRYTTVGHTGPPGYYLLFLLFAMLPWAMFFPKALVDLIKRFWNKKQRTAFDAMMVSWLAAAWWIYELLMSKSPAYVIAAFPPLSIVLAREILRLKKDEFNVSRLSRFGLKLFVAMAWILSVGLVAVSFFLLGPGGIAASIAAASVVGGVAVFSYRRFMGEQTNRAITANICMTFAFLLIAWAFIVPSVEDSRSVTKQIATLIGHTTPKDTTVVFSRNFHMPSLPFYINRTGRTYVQDKNLGSLKEMYLSEPRHVLLFREKKFNKFRQMLADEGIDVIRAVKLSAFMADRGKYIHIYVVYPRGLQQRFQLSGFIAQRKGLSA